jgi:hypothetical protein
MAKRIAQSPRNVRHAQVAWQIGDIKALRPALNDEQCADFLRRNSKYIQEAMVAAGWTCIETFLPPKPREDDE